MPHVMVYGPGFVLLLVKMSTNKQQIVGDEEIGVYMIMSMSLRSIGLR
jgi:hypothetical protein